MMREESTFCVLQGEGRLASGAECQIYRALREIVCARCKTAIRQGETFIRRKVDERLQLLVCLCVSCVPFKLLIKDQQLESPRQKNMQAHDVKQTSEDISRSIDERLGPALRRGRRAKPHNRLSSR